MKDVLHHELSIGNKVYVMPLKKFSGVNRMMQAIIVDINDEKKIAKCKLIETTFEKRAPLLRRENQIVLYKL